MKNFHIIREEFKDEFYKSREIAMRFGWKPMLGILYADSGYYFQCMTK